MGWFYGFKPHLICNDKGELLSFCLTPGNVDDRNQNVFKVWIKKLFGKIIADRGYVSSSLFEMLWYNGNHPVTGIKSNMKNRLMSLRDRILLRKRSVIETICDELKNICQAEHSPYRSLHNFIMNLIAALGAYCFFDKNLLFSSIWKNQADSWNFFIERSPVYLILSFLPNHNLHSTDSRMEYPYWFYFCIFL